MRTFVKFVNGFYGFMGRPTVPVYRLWVMYKLPVDPTMMCYHLLGTIPDFEDVL